MSLSTQKTKTN